MNYLIKTLTLTTMVEYLNTNMAKKNKTIFTISDVQGYIGRGKLPDYLGGYHIELENKIKGVKLYSIKL